MANSKHVEILLSGVENWNQWRLDNPDVQPDLEGVVLKDQNLENINLNGANLKGAQWQNIGLDAALLEGAILIAVNWKKVSGVGADFSEADFTKAKLTNCDFRKADLRHTCFAETSMEGCNFSGARLTEVNFGEATLDKIDFFEAFLDKPDFNQTTLIKPVFSVSQLDKSMLEKASVSDMQIRDAHISFKDESSREDVKSMDELEEVGAVREEGLAAREGDTVACSVYAPPEAAKGDTLMVQTWLHLLGEDEQVNKLAISVDDSATLRQYAQLGVPLQAGDRLRLVLIPRSSDIIEQTQHTSWQGNKLSLQFLIDVPADYDRNKLFFTLRVYRDIVETPMPVGEISFFVKIATQVTAVAEAMVPEGVAAKRYNYAFVSYSSRDREKVLSRVQMLKVFDQAFFMDIISLSSGEEWSPALEAHIKKCDLFLLFWSSNARNSEWVIKEVKMALARKNGQKEAPPHIQPIPLELPVVPPPPQLGQLHFNDSILYFIEAARK